MLELTLGGGVVLLAVMVQCPLLPFGCHVTSPVDTRATVPLGTLCFPLWRIFWVTVNIPNIKRTFQFSLWPAILTSCSYKSPGLLIITITHLTELLTSFPVGTERESFFSTLGGAASPNCQSHVGPGYWHSVASIGPSHFGYPPEHTAFPGLPQSPFRESFTLQRGQPGNERRQDQP